MAESRANTAARLSSASSTPELSADVLRCRVKPDDADVGGGVEEKQHKPTRRTFSLGERGLRPSFVVGPVAVLGLAALSELLVRCGHPR